MAEPVLNHGSKNRGSGVEPVQELNRGGSHLDYITLGKLVNFIVGLQTSNLSVRQNPPSLSGLGFIHILRNHKRGEGGGVPLGFPMIT